MSKKLLIEGASQSRLLGRILKVTGSSSSFADPGLGSPSPKNKEILRLENSVENICDLIGTYELVNTCLVIQIYNDKI